jgi:hypothetical protein
MRQRANTPYFTGLFECGALGTLRNPQHAFDRVDFGFDQLDAAGGG